MGSEVQDASCAQGCMGGLHIITEASSDSQLTVAAAAALTCTSVAWGWSSMRAGVHLSDTLLFSVMSFWLSSLSSLARPMLHHTSKSGKIGRSPKILGSLVNAGFHMLRVHV